MDEGATRKLDAIVGAAIRGLVEAGASDEAVGRFAVAHRAKVAQVLGQPAQAPEAPDLLALIRQAVGEAISAQQGAKAAPASTALRKQRIPVIIDGRRTSVTISPDLLVEVERVAGTRKRAVKVINDLAAGSPESENRSGWLESRLISYVQLAESAGAVGAAKH